MGEVLAQEHQTGPNPAILPFAIQVLHREIITISHNSHHVCTGCTDHSSTGNCVSLMTQLADMNDTALVQQLCENILGQTLCQRTCHDIFDTYGIDGTFC